MTEEYKKLLDDVNQTKEWLEGFKESGITNSDAETFSEHFRDFGNRAWSLKPNATTRKKWVELIMEINKLKEIYDRLPMAEEE